MADSYTTIQGELKLYLAKDKRYLRLKTAFSTLSILQVDTESLLTEVENLNNMRQVRKLNNTSPDFVDRVIKAAISDQSIRSRLTEILTEVIRIRRTVESALDSFVAYGLNKYKDTLGTLRTKGDKETAIKGFLSRYYKYLDDVVTLQQVITVVVEDLDKSHWTLKTVVEALKLIHVPERSLG